MKHVKRLPLSCALRPARAGRVGRVIVWSLLLVLLGIGSLTALAQGPGYAEVVKTASHDSAAKEMTVTYTIDVHPTGMGGGIVDVLDELPPELGFEGVLEADSSVIQPTFNPNTRQLTFQVNLDSGHSARLRYRARVLPQAECGADLINPVQVLVNGDPIGEPGEARLHIACSDLGDAPTSNNHFGAAMDAFPPTPAFYPTVFDPLAAGPTGPGPFHYNAELMHLGRMVSFEREADLGPDTDPTNNILPLLNIPNQDEFDDGLLNLPNLDFAHCQTATLLVEVYFDPAIINKIAFANLNVWFDGNRDGDWADVHLCQQEVPEHIVIDHSIPVVAPGYQIVTVTTTVPVFNPAPDPSWLRLTLSEQPSVKIGATTSGLQYGDGRGVHSTLLNPDTGFEVPGFHMGETEDYRFPRLPFPPGLLIAKTVHTPIANTGDTLRYRVLITNTNQLSVPVVFWDPIPPGTVYVDQSFGFNLPALFWGHDPVSNALYWHGELGPGQTLDLSFSVHVVRCETFGFTVLNEALAFEPGRPPVTAAAATAIGDCITPPKRDLRVEKRIANFDPGRQQLTFEFAVFNMLTRPLKLELFDPLPPQLDINPATLPPSFELVPPNILYGQFSFSQTEVLTVAVPATLAGLECVTNQAYWRTDIGLEGHTNPVQFLCADLGDAPDSTNHHGITNTAYFLTGTVVLTPDVAGQFPTVWESPPTEPSGPRHLDAGQAWLGNFVSHEDEADLGPDVDGPNNILNAGFDNANSDGGDDGWLNRQTPFPHCQESTLKVRVFKARPGLRHMFLNVWFDGTRDGDWNDIVPCDDQRHAFEWIVQNFVIDMHAWPPGTFRDIVVPTFLIANAKPDMPAWVRFTLSESPPPSLTNAELADGRGPHFPAAFRIGETEDYLIPGHPAGGFPGEVSIAKTASASAVQVGQVFTYSVYLTHTGGTAPVLVEMFDELPPPVELVDGPTVTELNPVANPLFAFFDAGHGPSGAVGWRGFLSPDAALRVDFAVRVKHCPPEGVAIHNVAVADLIGGGQLFADVTTPITCTPPRPPNITLTKRIIPDVGPPLTDWTTVPGEHIVYRLELSGTVDLTRTVIISDPMQPGVIAVAADASTGVAHVINGGQTVIWEGELTPGAPHAIVKILARLQDVQCGQVIENVAFWRTPFFGGNASNITHLRLDCHDLGDAPDSTNHFPGALMTAYPGITATFPTVFTATVPAGPPGPVHLRPQPLHLGPRVSFEIEADLGFDLDGRNNLEPVLDTPNLDKSDDGLDLDLLTFAHCKPLRFPVWVSIGPDAIAALGQEGTGYLNVWLDSNRDGDWADTFDCPPDPGTNFSVAREHIVIDQPVDVAALGPGLHKIFVETTSLVHWPDALRDKPAWLRLTLSDRPSNKPFGGYGDGRGYKNPFKLGETEDYLLRGPDEPPQADPTVEKEGFLHPFFRYNPQQPDREEMVWAVNWLVEYANVGHAVANNTKLIDTFDDRQQLDEAHSYPFILPGVAGNTLTYAIGALNPGQGGHIFIRTTVPFTTPPGTVLTNTVTITAANDGNPANNTRVVTQAIPLLPPRITYPRPGTTCTGTITVTGRSQIGSFVDLYVNGVYTATATVDPTTGAWAVPLSLPDGTHVIQAQARVASGPTSPMSPPVEVVVDSSLVWSPLSLHFTFEDETGGKHVIIPKDQNGRTDESGWFVFLRPGFSYTATVFICCDDPNASVTLAVPGGQTVNLTDPDDDGWFEGNFTLPSEGSLLTPPTIRLCVVCYNIQYCSDGKVLIDPEGVVYDVDIGPQSGLLSGAVAACYEAQTSIDSGQTTYGLWPAEDFSQVNPQTTASDGYFSFFTPAGTFQLDVTRTGYQSYRSWDIVVVDDPVEFNVPLAKIITQTAAYTVTISDAGFDPAVLTVAPGAVIQWVNIDGNQHTTTSLTPTVRTTTTARLAAPGPTDGWDSGLLNSGAVYKRQLNTIGQYSYYDHQNSAYTGLVIVQATNTVYLPLSIKN